MERGPPAATSGTGQSATHLIGPGPQLSQAVVFYVSVEDYVPPPPPETFGYADAVESPLRFYWRLCRDLELISLGQYGHGARMITEAGRLLGGWQKSLTEKPGS